MLALGCGSAPPAEPAPAPNSPPPVHEGRLSDYVPAAGLRWMLIGSPSELAELETLRGSLSRLLPEKRLDAFAEATGVRLQQTPQALVAQFDYATLYMARTGPNAVVEERFLGRLLTDPRIRAPHPRVRRVTGIIGVTPQTLVRIDNYLVAVSVGDPTPARVVELFARQRLRRTVVALRGSALSTLPVGELERAPVRFYAPGPFDGEWSRGAYGLFAQAVALGAAAEPRGEGLRVTVILSGSWEPASAMAKLLKSWGDLSASSLGHLLGLDRPLEEPDVQPTQEQLRFEVTLALAPLVHGLYSAVAADVWEMMDFSLRGTPSPPGSGKEKRQ